jgi:hypothetical protein
MKLHILVWFVCGVFAIYYFLTYALQIEDKKHPLSAYNLITRTTNCIYCRLAFFTMLCLAVVIGPFSIFILSFLLYLTDFKKWS